MIFDKYSIAMLRATIRTCHESDHVQQVAYSVYHDALTQVCFTCKCVRSSFDLQTEVKEANK